MNAFRFHALLRPILDGTFTRRALTLSMVGAAPAAALAPWMGDGLAARTRRKRKRRKKKPLANRFGCRNVGGECSSASQCCSGICERGSGKRAKRTCRAHDTGGCRIEQDSCSTSINFACVTATGEDGFCHLTTGNAPYCAFDGIDSECTRDEDCIELCGEGAACSVCAEPGLPEFRFCAGLSRCPGLAPEVESTRGGHAR